MRNVYLASKTILLFLVIMLVTQTLFGDKVAQKMALLILMSMLILQSETVTKYLTAIPNNLTANLTNETINGETSTSHISSSGVEHGGAGHTF